MTTKDDYQCTNLETFNCYMEEKVINDVTCTTTVEFNCKRDKSTKNDGYGPKGVVCSRKPKQDCYNIPRKVTFLTLILNSANAALYSDPSRGVQD